MGMFKLLSLLFVIPTTMILTVSYFVLVVNKLVTDKTLKAFGVIIAILLWISAATVFGVGVYLKTAAPKAMMKCSMMGAGMEMGKGCMGKGMMKDNKMMNMKGNMMMKGKTPSGK